jgi:spore photoproduct lyase
VRGLPGSTARERFVEAKKTLVIGVRRGLDFTGCRPSAHYQLPLATGCPGRCTYCYLHTTLGRNPYLRVYVNLDEIFSSANKYVKERLPEPTIFEGSATSDPLSVEHYTGALARTIEFFAGEEKGFFRFATKQTFVDPLLEIEHSGKTRIRISVNAPYVVKNFERGVPTVKERIMAALSLREKGYPVGFLIAPIMTFPGWLKEYDELLQKISRLWQQRIGAGKASPVSGPDPSFELITHRFTSRAKKNILTLFPETDLPMDEKDRKYKYGQFGYGKYVYGGDVFTQTKDLFYPLVDRLFINGEVQYLV